MDADRFDALARALTAAGFRRRALAAALAGSLGLLGLTYLEDVTARNCPPCKKRKNGKCS